MGWYDRRTEVLWLASLTSQPMKKGHRREKEGKPSNHHRRITDGGSKKRRPHWWDMGQACHTTALKDKTVIGGKCPLSFFSATMWTTAAICVAVHFLAQYFSPFCVIIILQFTENWWNVDTWPKGMASSTTEIKLDVARNIFERFILYYWRLRTFMVQGSKIKVQDVQSFKNKRRIMTL